MTEQTQGTESTRVECPARKDPAVRMFIIAAMLLGFDIWCFVDGYVYHRPKEIQSINDKLTWTTNYVGGIALPVLSLIPLGYGIAMLRRRLLADAEGLGFAGKPKVAWSSVTRLDSQDLAGKRILRLHYQANGQDRVLVLDGWRLENFKPLVALVEQKVGRA